MSKIQSAKLHKVQIPKDANVDRKMQSLHQRDIRKSIEEYTFRRIIAAGGESKT